MASLPRVTIRGARPDDWPRIADIYATGIATRNATFETEVPSFEEWDAAHLAEHRFVATDGDRVIGWVALTGYSNRCCYQGVADLSVYVDPAAQGRGVGRALLEHLVADTERSGIWTLQAGVFPENAASLAGAGLIALDHDMVYVPRSSTVRKGVPAGLGRCFS